MLFQMVDSSLNNTFMVLWQGASAWVQAILADEATIIIVDKHVNIYSAIFVSINLWENDHILLIIG